MAQDKFGESGMEEPQCEQGPAPAGAAPRNSVSDASGAGVSDSGLMPGSAPLAPQVPEPPASAGEAPLTPPATFSAAAGALKEKVPGRMPLSAEELFERYSPMVYNLALRLTGNPDAAQDLSQDAFLKAIRGLRSFRGESDPGTWIYRITMNVWKNRVRSEKRRAFWKTLSLDFRSESEEESSPLQIAAPDPPADGEIQQEQEKEAVEKALSELEPEDKAIIILRELDNRSYQDIADIIQVPIGTVKSRLSRAREALRRKLSPFVEGKTYGS